MAVFKDLVEAVIQSGLRGMHASISAGMLGRLNQDSAVTLVSLCGDNTQKQTGMGVMSCHQQPIQPINLATTPGLCSIHASKQVLSEQFPALTKEASKDHRTVLCNINLKLTPRIFSFKKMIF